MMSTGRLDHMPTSRLPAYGAHVLLIARIVASSMLLLLAVQVPAHSAAVAVPASVTVGGNDSLDAYIGDGGLLLPGSFTGTITTRNHVADCMGCVWKYSIYCAYGADGLCMHTVSTCRLGQLRYRVWFGRDAANLEVIGSVCWGGSTPLTRRDVERAVHDTAMRRVPPLRPGVDPAAGTLTSVPAVFRTGQPDYFRAPDMRLAGFTVRVSAVPRWRWSWGDGATAWTSNPGAPYPSTAVTHQYRRAGRYTAAVHTVWSASYTASGLGPFGVTGDPVTQDASLRVIVRASRVVLTPW